MNSFENLVTKAPELEQKLGHPFKNKRLQALAFVHRSYVNENRDTAEGHNERLEFLGDSVLGIIVSEYLYLKHPNEPEGELSKLRSRLVDAHSCYAYVQKLDIADYVLLSKGEQLNNGRGRESILADLFEAIIGAIYLDGGIEAAKRFLFDNFLSDMQKNLEEPVRNWKAELQDYTQKHYQQTPIYKVSDETGPDHSKVFEVKACINDEALGSGLGQSKKEAQQSAAKEALQKLNKPVGEWKW